MWNEFFRSEGIDCFCELPQSALRIQNPRRWERILQSLGQVESAVIFLIPYYAGQKTTNLSVYAQVRDYHLYIKGLGERFGAAREGLGLSELSYCAAADSSPIDERDAALSAGLGVLGKNGLVLNERYGSFFFIGELFLSRAVAPTAPVPHRTCPSCGACELACPTGAIRDPKREACLSLLTQKKNRSEAEEALVRRSECKWGCDLCQNVCPLNRAPSLTPIPFFQSDLVDRLTPDCVDAPDFDSRAFSWRGKSLVRKNLEEE